MNKKIIAEAVAAVIAAPVAMAESQVTVYGKIHNSVDFYDNDTTNTDYIDVADRDSRLGFKGSEDLGNGLKAIFKMEVAVNTSDLSAGLFGTGRNTYVGLAGDFGTVVVGRHDTPLKMSSGKLNAFADQMADYKNFARFEDVRAGDAIAYISPNFSGLTVAGAIIPGGNDGLAGEEDNLASGYSVAGMYNNAGLFVSLAYENKEDHTAGTDELTRAGIGYTMDAISLGLVYEWADNGAAVNSDTDKLYVMGKYKMGNNTIKAAYANVDADANVSDTDAWAIGLDHAMSKRTTAYVQYADSEHGLRTEAASGANVEASGFSIGMIHNF